MSRYNPLPNLRSVEERNTLALENENLVGYWANRYVSSRPNLWRQYSVDDALSEGFLGLLRACELYDPAIGGTFSTYASYWIRMYIGMGYEKTRFIHIPKENNHRHFTERIRLDKELARKAQVRFSQFSKGTTKDANDIFFDVEDLDSDVVEKVLENEKDELIGKALARLTSKDRYILKLCYWEGKTERAIAGELGVSPKAINNHKVKAYKKLRKIITDLGLYA